MYKYPILERHERRDGRNLHCSCQLRLGFGIHLGERDALMGLGGQLEDRGKSLAGAAPRCPEVNEHHLVIPNEPLEVRGG